MTPEEHRRELRRNLFAYFAYGVLEAKVDAEYQVQALKEELNKIMEAKYKRLE